MTGNAEWIKIGPERVLQTLEQEAVDKVNSSPGEVVLDFSAILRIDTKAVQALDQLAGLAAEKSVKVVLRAVNVDVYKVLKLLKLTGRFVFLD